MKSITKSLMMIGAVAALAIGGTVAYFSDTETSTGNTFTAGTIDISVDDPQTWQYTMADMKPGYVSYSNFTVENDGSNPVNVWKKVDGVTTDDNEVNEPECVAYGGTWSNDSCSGGTAVNNLDTVVKYDLSVVIKNASDVVVQTQTIYNLDKTIAQINALGGNGTFMGMIPEGGKMEVTESYHMDEGAGNQYQSDKMTFNITLFGEQLKGVAILEDKDPSDWRIKNETLAQVTMTYGVKDATLKINSLTGTVPAAGTYSLITYPESFSTPTGSGWPRTVTVLGTAVASGTTIDSFAQSVTDPGTFTNMKVWLVPSSDLSGSALNAWNPASYMFETGLIDYYKSN